LSVAAPISSGGSGGIVFPTAAAAQVAEQTLWEGGPSIALVYGKVLRLIVRAVFRLRVEGLENLPPPPYIIASNHQTWFDTVFIVAALPRSPMIYTMARRDTVFNRSWKRWLVPKFGVFPITPSMGELDQRGVATVYQVLARGGVVLIFPEGRYSRGRRLRPLKKGVAHFALQAGVPICPLALTGLDRLRPFGRVEVSIGHPIWPDPPVSWRMARRVERIVDRVRRGIQRALARAAEGGPTWRSRLRSVPSRLRTRLRHPLRKSLRQ